MSGRRQVFFFLKKKVRFGWWKTQKRIYGRGCPHPKTRTIKRYIHIGLYIYRERWKKIVSTWASLIRSIVPDVKRKKEIFFSSRTHKRCQQPFSFGRLFIGAISIGTKGDEEESWTLMRIDPGDTQCFRSDTFFFFLFAGVFNRFSLSLSSTLFVARGK